MGSLPKSIEKFQQSNTETRVFIGCQRSFGGISIDDPTGNFPRFMFSMRNYGAIGNTQLISRINRYGTLGIATFYFLWSCDEEFELNKGSSDQLVYPIEIFLS